MPPNSRPRPRCIPRSQAVGAVFPRPHVLVVEPADLHDILQHLKDHQSFEFLVDVTAVDYDGYPQPGRFGVLWILRNFEAEADLVVKTYDQACH